jgi:hypothetical protein
MDIDIQAIEIAHFAEINELPHLHSHPASPKQKRGLADGLR